MEYIERVMPNSADANLARLDSFVGTWDTEGEVRVPGGPPVKFKATDTYEWLPGGYFMLHRFDAHMPEGNVQGIEVIGYDEGSKSYSMNSFDSLGNSSVMKARIEKDQWTYTGEATRFTGEFNEKETVFSGLWELRDKEMWQPWMDVKLKKRK
jgi:hypothetical protein